MTTAQFREIALSFPGTEERAHMDHPDFRVNGKIFATLGYPDKSFGMVKLPPEHQHNFTHDEPEAFTMVNGAWGKKGATRVVLAAANGTSLRKAMEAAVALAVGQTKKKRSSA